MGVYLNKNKLYSIRGKYKGSDGSWVNYHRFTAKNGFKSKKQAERADIEFRERHEIMSDEDKLNATMTFENLKEIYYEEARHQIKLSTIYTDEKILVLFKDFDSLLIHKISAAKLRMRFKELDKKEYSVSYMNKAYFTINKLFKFAKKKKWITNNPMDDVERIKRPNEYVEDKHNYWTLEEFQEFIKHVDNQLYYTMFNFFYLSGCRRGEVIALQWDDIDFDNNTFRINKTCFQHKGEYKLTPPKTKNSNRVRVMSQGLKGVLKDWYSVQKDMYNFSGKFFVFGGDIPISETTLQRQFTKYIKDSDVRKITIHGFRHSHVSLLTNNDANQQDVAFRIGDTLEQIQKTYSHFFPPKEKEVIQTLDDNVVITRKKFNA